MSNNITNKVPDAAFTKTRDYFLGESLRPSENIPDMLAENRKIAITLAESVMSLLDVISQHFGISALDLAMAALPEVSLQLETDGVREQAAARTYLDLKGAVPLADICKGAYAYPAPTLHCVAKEILRREKFARYAPNDPLLQRIFSGTCEEGDGSDTVPEDEPEGEEDGGLGSTPKEYARQVWHAVRDLSAGSYVHHAGTLLRSLRASHDGKICALHTYKRDSDQWSRFAVNPRNPGEDRE